MLAAVVLLVSCSAADDDGTGASDGSDGSGGEAGAKRRSGERKPGDRKSSDRKPSDRKPGGPGARHADRRR